MSEASETIRGSDPPVDVVPPPLEEGGDDEPGGPSARLIRKNLSVVAVTYLISGAAGFVAQAVLARQLGHGQFGIYFAALSLVAIVQVLDRLAREEYVVREGARDRGRLETLVGDVLALKVVTGLLVVIVSAVAALALGLPSEGVQVAIILAVMAAFSAAGDSFRSGLQAIERLEIGSTISVVNAVVSAAGMIVIVLLGGGLVAAVGFSALVTILSVPVTWVYLRRHVRVRVRSSVRTMLQVARESFPFAVAGFLTVASGYVDALVVQGFLGQHATGLYGAAYRMIVVMGWIPLIFQTSTYRSMAYLAHKARAEFGPFVQRSAATMFVVGLPLAAGGWIVGGRLLTLVFGNEFAGGTDAFRALLCSLPFVFTAVPLTTAVVVDERPQAAAWIFGASLTLNLTANLLLVPHYGIEAAAWITVATEAFIAALATVVLAFRGVRPTWLLLAAPSIPAAVLMMVLAERLEDLPFAVPVLIGAIAYAGLLLALGVPRRLGLRLRLPRRQPAPEQAP